MKRIYADVVSGSISDELNEIKRSVDKRISWEPRRYSLLVSWISNEIRSRGSRESFRRKQDNLNERNMLQFVCQTSKPSSLLFLKIFAALNLLLSTLELLLSTLDSRQLLKSFVSSGHALHQTVALYRLYTFSGDLYTDQTRLEYPPLEDDSLLFRFNIVEKMPLFLVYLHSFNL